MKLPTDLEILNVIYTMYAETFRQFTLGAVNDRETKIYVPVDCKAVAEKLDTDGDIVFGRLYYHLQEKYGYTRADGSSVGFFLFQVGLEKKCINFPLMASILAGMQDEASRARRATWLSATAIFISIVGVIVQVLSFN